ncbi:sec-independent protein translocase protein TatA [Desulfitispora alkaliphila]|uniref:Sec-independent protein translocase subunit TatA/TatB n=1 Tax=Desulfitispora alkaliphila TaxID=622674 RepID=UPI003D1AEDB1
MFGFIPNFGVTELILILALALIIFGPGKLPEIGKSLGSAIKEFKSSTTDVKKDIEDSIKGDDEEQKKA